MGKKNRNRSNDAQPESRQYSASADLIQTVQTPFLKDRLTAYFASAERLIAAWPDSEPKEIEKIVAAYGKSARLLDLILAIGGASGYLPAHDRDAAWKIRDAMEKRLDTYTKRQGDSRSFKDGFKVETNSALGRKIAGLFARVVPPTAQDEAIGDKSRGRILSGAADAKLTQLLKTANASFTAGQFQEAAEKYEEILGIDRKNGEAIRNLGIIHGVSGNLAHAIDYLREARLLYPTDVGILNQLAQTLSSNTEYDEAIEIYKEALTHAPDNIESLADLSVTQMRKGLDDEARETMRRALELQPNSPDTLVKLGIQHQMHYELEEASLCFAKALKLAPKHAKALSRLGIARSNQRKGSEALELMERAEILDPHNIDILCAKGFAHLAEGQYEEGWRLHENGLKSRSWRPVNQVKGVPIWDGAVAPGKKLLITCEQGLGDSLQFVRYAALCKKRVGKVSVLCDRILASLFENCPFIDEVVPYDGISRFTLKRNCDFQISMMSLPYVFGTTLETVPAEVPYLFVSNDARKKWAQRILPRGEGLRVGLVWAGSPFRESVRGDLRARMRNMKLEWLLPLFDAKDVVFYNLQIGEEKGQIDSLDLRDRFVDLTPDIKDMQDTAAIIENLDLVISVCTSVAHLAGGLGKPVWIMLNYYACWRWLGNRPTSPWYPTARVYGQPSPGDWNSMVAEIRAALDENIRSHRQNAAEEKKMA